VLDLINVLNAAYDFVNAAEPLKKIENRQRSFGQLLKETNECAYFIREYLSDPDFGEYQSLICGCLLKMLQPVEQ
jgi:hypothetical protein